MTQCSCGYDNKFNDTETCGYCGELIVSPTDLELAEKFRDDADARIIQTYLPKAIILEKSQYWYRLDCSKQPVTEIELIRLFKHGFYNIAGIGVTFVYISNIAQADEIAKLHRLQ